MRVRVPQGGDREETGREYVSGWVMRGMEKRLFCETLAGEHPADGGFEVEGIDAHTVAGLYLCADGGDVRTAVELEVVAYAEGSVEVVARAAYLP